MAMTYGSIDKSKDRRNNLDHLVKQLEELINIAKDVTNCTNELDQRYTNLENIEQLAKDSLKTARKLKG